MSDKHITAEAAFNASIKRLSDESEALSIEITNSFAAGLSQNSPINISEASRELISRRVLNVDRYATPHGVLMLLDMDISSLCDRIISYPYIPRYRRRITDEDYQGRAALIIHIHSLTGAEMYTVLERATALIRDVWLLASDYGIAGENCAAAFQKRFRKRFDRALRERHRVAHAHEAPSMQSRAINAANRARDLPVEVIPSVIQTLMSNFLDNVLDHLADEAQQSDFLEKVNRAASVEGQEGRYVTEASDALAMVRDYLRRAIKSRALDQQV